MSLVYWLKIFQYVCLLEEEGRDKGEGGGKFNYESSSYFL